MHIIEPLLGAGYFSVKRQLMATEYQSAGDQELLQRRELSEILEFAVRNIPFYHSRLSHLSGAINADNSFECLKSFPYMTKIDIREHLDNLVRFKPLRTVMVSTGGTSASPMPFYIDRFITRQREKAFMWNQWARVGYNPGDSIASFTGSLPKGNRLYFKDKFFNKYSFSSFVLIPDKIQEIFTALEGIRPRFFHGYPSTLYTLAKLIKHSGRFLSFKPQAVLCGSEKVHSEQRKLIEEVFRSRVYSWYGHSEMCALGGECEYSTDFHFFPQYGYIEFYDSGMIHSSGEKLHELIVTSFNNFTMPFIRYRTRDYVVLKKDVCRCGRHYPLVEDVIGRLQEFVVDSQCNLLSVTALTSLFEKMLFIDETCIVQERPGIIRIEILPNNKPSNKELEEISELIERATQGRLKTVIELVKNLQRQTNGKQLLVKQFMDIESYLI